MRLSGQFESCLFIYLFSLQKGFECKKSPKRKTNNFQVFQEILACIKNVAFAV